MVRRYRPPGSPPPVPRRRPRYTGRPDGPWNIGLFAGYDAGFAPQEGDGWDPAWELTSHGPNDDASGAGEDTVPDDGDDQANQGAVRSPTGRLAARSSRNGDRLRSESRKIYLEGDNDVLQRIRDVSKRCREPKRYYLGVLVFPQEADGRVRLFVDQMVPSTGGPPSPPAAPSGLNRPKRPRPRNE